MKTDLRVRYTRKVIRDAFLKLLQEKPLAKITVREVCELAEINRGTFYKHYLDCYDLMEKLQEEAVANFEALLDSLETGGIENSIVSILETLQSDSAAYSLFNSQWQAENFRHRLVGCCYRCMEKRISGIPGMDCDQAERKLPYCFLLSGSCGVIEYWIHTGMREPAREMAAQILRLSETFLRGIGQEEKALYI